MNDSDSFALRLHRVESKLEIAELCDEYCQCIDGADLDGLMALFCHDAQVAIPSFGVAERGRAALRRLFEAQVGVLTESYHWTHDHVVRLVDADHAAGRLSAHAEVGIAGDTYVVGVRYEDRYARENARWLFESRRILFMYYTPVAQFRERFLQQDRVMTQGGWARADFPVGRRAPGATTR